MKVKVLPKHSPTCAACFSPGKLLYSERGVALTEGERRKEEKTT
jgi:hypothetical protein